MQKSIKIKYINTLINKNKTNEVIEYYREYLSRNDSFRIKLDYINFLINVPYKKEGTLIWLEDEMFEISNDIIKHSPKFKYYGVISKAIIEMSFSMLSKETYEYAKQYLNLRNTQSLLYPYMLMIIYEYNSLYNQNEDKHILLEIIKVCPQSSLAYEYLGNILIKDNENLATEYYNYALKHTTILDKKEYSYTFSSNIIEFFTKTKRYQSSYENLVNKCVSCPTVPKCPVPPSQTITPSKND